MSPKASIVKTTKITREVDGQSVVVGNVTSHRSPSPVVTPDTHEKVTVYPIPGMFLNGVPAVEQEVTPERADELLGYKSPAFTRIPPSKPQE